MQIDADPRVIISFMDKSLPLDWINFGADFSFDAYVIHANIDDDMLRINAVPDQARRETK